MIFVYNANSGRVNALLDAGHKLLSPSTYPCSLCALTHNTFTENKIWNTFRNESDIDMMFYHKDEFESHFPNANIVYPIVLKLENKLLSTVLNNEALDKISNIEHLISRLKAIL